jgi:ComEC/Rec2-related protein
LLVIPILWFYAGATGWAASAIRATVMMSAVLAGWAARRPSDLLNSLAAAALIILAWQPQQLFQAGFQLSFVVVACMAVVGPALRQIRLRKPDPLAPPAPPPVPGWRTWLSGYARETLLASLAAWLGSIPLTAYYFNLFSMSSVPGNLVVIPICVLCLICNLASLLAGGVFPAVSGAFNNAAWLFMKMIVAASQWAADFPRGAVYVAAPSLAGMVFYYLALATVPTGLILKSPRNKWAVIGLSLLGSVWLAQAVARERVINLHILSDRGAEIAFLDTPRGRDVTVVNTGRSNSVERLVKPFLGVHGVNRLPRLILNHGDTAHAGGLPSVMESFRPAAINTGPFRTRSAVFDFLGERTAQKESRWEPLAAGAQAGVWRVVYPPEGNRAARAEDDAVVLLGDLNRARVLLLSNLGRAGQHALLGRSENLAADILVAAVSAGGDSVIDSLLDAARPSLVVIVDGEPGSAQRAPEALRERFQSRAQAVLWTHETGSVQFKFAPGRWRALSADGRELARGAPGHREKL